VDEAGARVVWACKVFLQGAEAGRVSGLCCVTHTLPRFPPRFIETLFGRRRYLPLITSDDPLERGEAERQAVNSTFQVCVCVYVYVYVYVYVCRGLSPNRNHSPPSPYRSTRGEHDAIIPQLALLGCCRALQPTSLSWPWPTSGSGYWRRGWPWGMPEVWGTAAA
jgi:hypothetical protein